tara:strand:- start:6962 stop:10303 length:3342 start_codon:yes stop_codon:yes gene_type:complete
MSVRIELLEYKYDKANDIDWSNDANSLINWTTNTGVSLTNSSATTSVKISSNASSVTGGIHIGAYNSIVLNNNNDYKLTYNVVAYNNNGQTASKIFIRGDSSAGGDPSYYPTGINDVTSTGYQQFTFTIDTSLNNGSNAFRFFVQLTGGNVSDKHVRLNNVTLFNQTIDTGVNWFESVVGELDITDSKNFPLALNFQISDIKDLTSTTGDFSKTFKVPATKNNNNIFKHLYIANINSDTLTGGIGTDVTERLKCRIIINGLSTLNGILKVTGVGGYGDNPAYYNCIFLGSNIGWADELDNVYMSDIDWGRAGQGLLYNYNSVTTSWNQEDSDNMADGTSNSGLIVYPLISYGEYNEGGEENTVQLLKTKYEYDGFNAQQVGYQGMYNHNALYGNPNPQPDWRPAIWVKKTLETIFASIGYSIDSEFVKSSIFRHLVWTLPNFKCYNIDEKYADFSIEADWSSSVNLSTSTTSVDYANPYPNPHNYQYAGFGVQLGTLNTAFSYSAITQDTNITYTDAASSTWTGFSDYADSVYPGKNATTLATGGGSYFEIDEYGYYQIELSDCSVHFNNLLMDGSQMGPLNVMDVRYPEFMFTKIQYRVQRQSPGQTSWDSIATMTEDDPHFNIPGQYGETAATFVGVYSLSTVSSYNPWPSLDGDASGGGNTIDVNDDISFTKWLNKGDKIRILLQIKGRPATGSGTTYPQAFYGTFTYEARPIIGKFSIKLDPSVVEWGQTYDLKNVIDPEQKVVDFIKGISHAFNLKVTTDELTKKVTLEPFEDFYKPFNEAIDFTYKADMSKLTEDNWLKSDLKRDIIFKYKSDNKDKKVEDRGDRYFEGVKDEYPYQENLSNNFERGETVFENPFFAGTYNAKDQQIRDGITSYTNNAPTACLWEDDPSSYSQDRPDKGYDFLPRLLYWKRYDSVTKILQLKNQKVGFAQCWENEINILIPGVGIQPTTSNFTELNVFPHAVSYNVDKTSYPVLTYGNINIRKFGDTTGNYDDPVIGKGLYETYYKQMFEMLKSRPRVRTVYIDLDVTDILNLDFRKLIYLNGVYYRLNKIIDYQPNKNTSTKVELIEWLQLGTFAATSPALDDATIGTGGSNGTSIPDIGTNNSKL